MVVGNREEDLAIVELHFASDMLCDPTHKPMEKTNYSRRKDCIS